MRGALDASRAGPGLEGSETTKRAERGIPEGRGAPTTQRPRPRAGGPADGNA